MNTRHTLARLGTLLGLALSASGCFFSHGAGGREEPRADAGTFVDPDAGTAPVADAGLAPSPPSPGPMPAPSCGGSARISVSIETVGGMPCGPGRFEGVMLGDVAPTPDGVRLMLDMCPLADADCRCAVNVSGVPPTLASNVDTNPESGPTMTAVLAEDGVLVEAQRDCSVADDSCIQKVVFAAMDGSLETPPFDASQLDVRWGDGSTCSGAAPDIGPDCSRQGYPLIVTTWEDGFPGAIGTEQPVVEGTTVTLDGAPTMFEAIRASQATCPDVRFARTAAWVAWAAILPGE